MPYFCEIFGNPSSSHSLGKKAKDALTVARTRFATALGCRLHEVFFTSGATESINWAIKGAARSQRRRYGTDTILISAVEHVAVTNTVTSLEELEGFRVVICPVNEEGIVELKLFRALMKSLRRQMALVSICHANAEVGSIQPIQELASIMRQESQYALFHCDASQSLGKIEVCFKDMAVDMLTIAGHKAYAPKGVGALVVRDGVEIDILQHGGGQETGRRGGTENVAFIAALGEAACLSQMSLRGIGFSFLDDSTVRHTSSRQREIRQAFEQKLLSKLETQLGAETVRLNGPRTEQHKLPNTISLSIKGLRGSKLVKLLANSVAVSTGSACHSECEQISDVLKACGVTDRAWGLGTIRISIGRFTSNKEMEKAVELIGNEIVTEFKKLSIKRDVYINK